MKSIAVFLAVIAVLVCSVSTASVKELKAR
jgi:hypothetical protein